jgi:shikimate dehydrogenase
LSRVADPLGAIQPSTQGAIQVGLIGASIQQSKSPALHEAEARALGLDLSYRLIDLKLFGAGVEALPELLATAQADGFAGVNITHPCKQAVLPLLNDLSDEAALIGAVNTVVFKDGRRLGYNTDEWGFRESFRRQMDGARLDRVVQLGAGGAGAATAHAMLSLGAGELALFDADPARAQNLAHVLGAHFGADRVHAISALPSALAEADGLVHATPVGMADHPGLPFDSGLLRQDLWVAEVVYFPLETALLAQARRIGARTINGGGMAVFQAARAFRLFTGVEPDPERMLAHFLAEFAGSGELSA